MIILHKSIYYNNNNNLFFLYSGISYNIKVHKEKCSCCLTEAWKVAAALINQLDKDKDLIVFFFSGRNKPG